MSTIKRDQARAAGYRALTNTYQLPQEQELLDGVLADMRRGRIDHVVVKVRGGVAVWRRGRLVISGATPHPYPSPLGKGRGELFSDVVTRGGALSGLPRATILNPAGVLETGRLRRREGVKQKRLATQESTGRRRIRL